MTHTYPKNGKKTASVNVFIDPESGFSNPTLTPAEGGSLYVPGGEEVASQMGEIIRNTRDGVFVVGQDYHPKNHISFMSNHPGVMAHRIAKFTEFLKQHNQPHPAGPALVNAAQQPVHFFAGLGKPPVAFPFEEMVLDKESNIIGLKESDGRIRRVNVRTESGHSPSRRDRGRIGEVLAGCHQQSFDEMKRAGLRVHTQTLWTNHCEQATKSSLFPDDLHLPEGLNVKLNGDFMSRTLDYHDPETGNTFYVVRKGFDSEIDSYGIGVENDGKTLTPAMEAFQKISEDFQSQGIEQVDIYGGGLASNFCVEFSLNNIADFLAGWFKMKNLHTNIYFVPEISRGIPIPGGAEVPFSAAGVAQRLLDSRGIGQTTIAAIIAAQKPAAMTL